jgi:hypothetical protein
VSWNVDPETTWVLAALGTLNLLALACWIVTLRFRVVLARGARRRAPGPRPLRWPRRARPAAVAQAASPAVPRGEARLAEDLKSWRRQMAVTDGAAGA